MPSGAWEGRSRRCRWSCPGARYLKSHVVYVPAARTAHEWAPIVPGANVIGPEVLHARPPEMAQESTHRKFTGSRRIRGCCAFRHAAAWGDLQLWRRLGRSATVSGAAAWGGAPSFLSSLSPHWPYAHSVSCLPAVYISRVPFSAAGGSRCACGVAVRPPPRPHPPAPLFLRQSLSLPPRRRLWRRRRLVVLAVVFFIILKR